MNFSYINIVKLDDKSLCVCIYIYFVYRLPWPLLFVSVTNPVNKTTWSCLQSKHNAYVQYSFELPQQCIGCFDVGLTNVLILSLNSDISTLAMNNAPQMAQVTPSNSWPLVQYFLSSLIAGTNGSCFQPLGSSHTNGFVFSASLSLFFFAFLFVPLQ